MAHRHDGRYGSGASECWKGTYPDRPVAEMECQHLKRHRKRRALNALEFPAQGTKAVPAETGAGDGLGLRRPGRAERAVRQKWIVSPVDLLPQCYPELIWNFFEII